MNKPSLSLIIPCFNESKNIPLLLKRFAVLLDRDDVEMIIVDNGSTDETSTVVKKLLPGYPFVKLEEVKENRGYGGGIKAGLANATGEYIGWTHADMQTDPCDALKALKIIEKEYNSSEIFVKGKRTGRPLVDVFFTFAMSIYETVYLGEYLNDINAQPNIFHRSFYDGWKDAPDDFSLDLFAFYNAKRSGKTIIRFPVVFSKRIYGISKWNTGFLSRWKFIKRTIEFSGKLKRSSNGIHCAQD